MAHNYIEEKITKNTFETGIQTLVDAKNLFTTQTTLQGVPGDLVVKNIYTFSANVVDGDTNTAVDEADRGKLTYRTEEIRIKPYKLVYDITNKEKRQNGDIIPFSAQGASEEVWNKINDDYYLELAKITKQSDYTGSLTWDAVETALGELELEDYSDMYLLVSPKDFSALKKSLKGVTTDNTNIVFKGQLIMVDGLAIVRSKKVVDGTSYIAKKDTIINEVKMDADVKVDVYNELEKETYVVTFAGLVYLASEKYAIKLVKTA